MSAATAGERDLALAARVQVAVAMGADPVTATLEALAAARQDQREADARIAESGHMRGWTGGQIAQAIRQGDGA